MIKNKKGASFVTVVGTIIMCTIMATTVLMMASNNSILVNKHLLSNKEYSNIESKLKSAANYLIKSVSEDKTILVNNITATGINETIGLPSIFEIDEVTDTDISDKVTIQLDGGEVDGYQVTLRKQGFYICCFLSSSGTQQALSDVLFGEDTNLGFVYKTGFLASSYIYEQNLYYNSKKNNGPVRTNINSSIKSERDAASDLNTSMYNTLLPETREENPNLFEEYTVDGETSTRYKTTYVDGKGSYAGKGLMNLSIANCIPSSSVFNAQGSTWDKLSYKNTFSKDSITYINGDLNLGSQKQYTLELKENAIVYVNGDLIMNYTKAESKRLSIFLEKYTYYYATKLTLADGALLVVKGDIIINNSGQFPYINCSYKSNVICGGSINISGNFVGYYSGLTSGIQRITEIPEGKLYGNFITNNDFIVSLNDSSNLGVTDVPTSMTVYADNTIDLRDSYMALGKQDSGDGRPTFLFADNVYFSNKNNIFDTLFSNGQMGYLFIIFDTDFKYNPPSQFGVAQLKANIFTTNEDYNDEIARKVDSVYNQERHPVLQSIFDWVGIDADVGTIDKSEIKNADQFGLPNVLTQGVSESYHNNVRKYYTA